ncbi:hypothetical protein CCP2SC5_510020 [Azospirillaceae bacterium]
MLVEKAFRDSKLTHLEVRPIFVRNDARTRGHALVVMLAYLILRHLRLSWQSIDATVQESLNGLASLTAINVRIGTKGSCLRIPSPRDDIKLLFQMANVSVPSVLPGISANVSTKKKLIARRILK